MPPDAPDGVDPDAVLDSGVAAPVDVPWGRIDPTCRTEPRPAWESQLLLAESRAMAAVRACRVKLPGRHPTTADVAAEMRAPARDVAEWLLGCRAKGWLIRTANRETAAWSLTVEAAAIDHLLPLLTVARDLVFAAEHPHDERAPGARVRALAAARAVCAAVARTSLALRSQDAERLDAEIRVGLRR